MLKTSSQKELVFLFIRTKFSLNKLMKALNNLTSQSIYSMNVFSQYVQLFLSRPRARHFLYTRM